MAHDRAITTEASVAGGGAGTFILALADRLPAEYGLLKTLLIYASPAISVGLALVWIAVAAWVRRRKRRADMEAFIAEARSMRDAVCADPNASDEHKKKARENVEELEQLAMELLKDEAGIVRAQLTAIR